MPVYPDASRAATGMLDVLAISTLSSVCFLEAAAFIVRTLTLSVASARRNSRRISSPSWPLIHKCDNRWCQRTKEAHSEGRPPGTIVAQIADHDHSTITSFGTKPHSGCPIWCGRSSPNHGPCQQRHGTFFVAAPFRGPKLVRVIIHNAAIYRTLESRVPDCGDSGHR